MEENLTDNEVIGEDWREEFEIFPADLLNKEIHFKKDKAHKDFVDDLYRVCRRLSTHQKPFLITNESSIDSLVKYLTQAESIPDYPPIVFNNIPKKFRSKELQMQLEKEPKTISERIKRIASQVQKEKKSKEKVNTLSLGTDEIVPETIKEKAESFQQIKNFAAFDVFHCQADVRYKKKYKNEDYYGSEDFKLCFAFALRQMPKPKIREFLKYRLKKDFNSDKQEFSDFIKTIIDGYFEPKFFPSHLAKPVNNFLGENYMPEVKTEVEKNNTSQEKQFEIDKEIDLQNTEARVRAMKYLLLSLDTDSSNQKQEGFIRFIFGKDEKKTQGSREQKFFNNTLKGTKEKQIEFLKELIEKFESLKLAKPLELAKKDLDSLNRLKK